LVPAAEAVSEAMCWVETPAGKPQVRWNGAGAVTPFGQMAFFNDFLNLSGLRDAWTESRPLVYQSPNAPSRRALLGTWPLWIPAVGV
jgi:hypothetical protein